MRTKTEKNQCAIDWYCVLFSLAITNGMGEMGSKNKLSKCCLAAPSQKAQKGLRKQQVPLEQMVILLSEVAGDSKSQRANLYRMAHALTPNASKEQRRNLQASLMQMAAAPAQSLHTPYKKKPCSGCPALRAGICKCAKKKLTKH